MDESGQSCQWMGTAGTAEEASAVAEAGRRKESDRAASVGSCHPVVVSVPAAGGGRQAGSMRADVLATPKRLGSFNSVKCDICSCEMSSDLVLSSHINGSRHKKRMKALEIVANLKASGEKGVELGPYNSLNAYRCEVCSLTVNSPQQLEIHLSGTKHKNRLAKEKCINSASPGITSSSQDPKMPVANIDVVPPKRRKKDVKAIACNLCNVVMNSETQYKQHALSKWHLNRMKGENHRPKRRFKLENKLNLAHDNPVNRYHGGGVSDRTGSQESVGHHHPPHYVNRLFQVHSPQNGFSNMTCSQLNNDNNSDFCSGYYQSDPHGNGHRNFGTAFAGALVKGVYSKIDSTTVRNATYNGVWDVAKQTN